MNGNREFTDLHKLLDSLERSGIIKISQLRDFMFFVEHEGKTMAEVAGGSRNQEYARVVQAMLHVGKGRADKEAKGPGLVETVTKHGNARDRSIRITPKGKRVFKKLCEYVESNGRAMP
ncbi:MAG: hypothetical protein AAF465_13500 [Pseudomonadota bacterium]